MLYRSSVVLACVLFAGAIHAQESDPRHVAPGFTARPAGSKLLIVPADMELFSISAGGVREPKADWTEAAQRNFRAALAARRHKLGPNSVELNEAELDEFAELNALQHAVAEAVFIHHVGMGMGMKLPTKNERLDWSLGEAVKPDLNTGRVVWFNDLQRMSGDLRDGMNCSRPPSPRRGWPSSRGSCRWPKPW